LIRENKIHEIPLIIDTSAEIGMVSLNRYLANLVRAKEIDIKVAQDYSLDPSELRNFIKR
jgi:twitching motility protein PilT